MPAANIGLAIVGQIVVNSTFVLLLGVCAKVGLTFFKSPTIAKPQTGIFSDFSPAMQTPDYPGVLLSYAQTEFLLAEAVERDIAVGGTAASNYNNAIAASIRYWGGTETDVNEYLLQPAVAYATAAGSWQQKLGYQKWIANYNMNWDSWTDIRRLGHPNLDVVNPPIGAKGQLPLRFTYPANESGSNAINWQKAVSKIPGGKDVVAAKLFWMK